jgi:hypothetical protein
VLNINRIIRAKRVILENWVSSIKFFLSKKSALFIIIYFIVIEFISSIITLGLLYGSRLRLLLRLRLFLRFLD